MRLNLNLINVKKTTFSQKYFTSCWRFNLTWTISGFKLPSLPASPATQALDKAPSRVEPGGNSEQDSEKDKEETDEKNEKDDKSSAVAPKATIPAVPLAYEEPSWGGAPDSDSGYFLEVLKGGSIVQTIKLVGKSYFCIGRLPQCDLYMEHPSLSRNHAIIQFKATSSPEKPSGFYLFDLDSTHGSWHNKNKCFPRTYYRWIQLKTSGKTCFWKRLRVGHMMKFGGSTRLVILQGPSEVFRKISYALLANFQNKKTSHKFWINIDEPLLHIMALTSSTFVNTHDVLQH